MRHALRTTLFALALLAVASAAPPPAAASDDGPIVDVPTMVHPAIVVNDTMALPSFAFAFDVSEQPAIAFAKVLQLESQAVVPTAAAELRTTAAVQRNDNITRLRVTRQPLSNFATAVRARDRPPASN